MAIATHNPGRRPRRIGNRFFIVLLCSLVVLAGCGNGAADDDGHRFASDRQPTAQPTETPDATPMPEVATQPTPEPTLPAAEILNVRGAPQFAYFIIDGQLQVHDSASQAFRTIVTQDDFAILDFAPSPTGDRVGVLGLVNDDVVVQFFGADGEPLGDTITLRIAYLPVQISAVASPIASPVATPTTSVTPITLYVTWVPQGNAVVVSGPGVLQRVSMSGEIMPISRSGVTGSVVKAFWSPMDSQVAIQTENMDGHQRVFMLDSGLAEAHELEPLNLQPGQHISNLQWEPTGLGLVFVAGNASDGDLMNGQLYIHQIGESSPTLLATSGQGGPAGTITHAVVSPDGHSVAYAIMVRDQHNWHLHSLWVKPIRGGNSVQIPTRSNAPVSNVLWTAEGLVWQQEDGSISVVDEELAPRPLGEEPQATPVASPQSTPVIEATPRG